MKKALLLVFSLIFLSGCASVNSVSLTSIPAERKNQVKVEKSKMIILGLNFDNKFVEEAVEDLKGQCPRGRVTGLLTKDETIMYFLFFVLKKQITATGYCVSNVASNNMKRKSRGTASEEPAVESAGEL